MSGQPIDTSKTHYRFTPNQPVIPTRSPRRAPLTDGEVKRIAREVAKILRDERRPLPVDVVTDAKHDPVHVEVGPSRPAKSHR